MQRRTAIAVSVLAVLAVVLTPLIGAAIGHGRMNAAYGDTPRLGVEKSDVDADCQVVTSVTPKARYNWLGQTWQDETLQWDAIVIEVGYAGSQRIVQHEKAGPITVGDRVCGLAHDLPAIWIFEPDGIVLQVVE